MLHTRFVLFTKNFVIRHCACQLACLPANARRSADSSLELNLMSSGMFSFGKTTSCATTTLWRVGGTIEALFERLLKPRWNLMRAVSQRLDTREMQSVARRLAWVLLAWDIGMKNFSRRAGHFLGPLWVFFRNPVRFLVPLGGLFPGPLGAFFRDPWAFLGFSGTPGYRPPGVRKMTSGSPNAHCRWPTALNRDHSSTRRPREREETNEICGRRVKKATFLGGPVEVWRREVRRRECGCLICFFCEE